MRLRGYIIIAFVCLFYWLLDSIWAYLSFEINLKKLIFSEPASYIDTFLLQVSPYQIVSRLMVVFLFAVIGVLLMEFITRRHKIERERKDAHDRLLKVLDSIDATIYVSDLKTGEILFMNQHMIDTFGGDFTGRICHEVFRDSDQVCAHCTNDQLLDEHGNPKGLVVWEGQNPITNAWYINHDRAINWIDGSIVHLQIATDITQLKELQQKQALADTQLRQAQKMESIGQLAGGIAHDFNNILASILGFSELALIEVEKGSKMEKKLQEIYAGGLRAKEIVRQILAFARQSDEDVKPIKIETVILEALKLIRPSTPSTIEIRKEIDSSSQVMGNETQIHQIIMNLCANAAHAMQKDGGILTVTLKDVIISEETDPSLDCENGDYVELTVSDTGYGIEPDIIERIFDPYFTTKQTGEGTGMGLAMVRGIVDSYGGSITVTSIPDKKTVFTVYLPITSKLDTEALLQPESLSQGDEHILLVDDEPAVAHMEGEILESLGYRVTTKTNSIEALELVKESPNEFQLVITDMTMPHMAGDKLALEIKKIRADLPIILCTGYSNSINPDTAREIGIDDFIYKPFSIADLAGRIKEVQKKFEDARTKFN